jgi:hypothetical protein
VRRSPAGFPTCPGFAAIEADCSRPYLPIRDGFVYAIRARTRAQIHPTQIARSPSPRMSQLGRRPARGTLGANARGLHRSTHFGGVARRRVVVEADVSRTRAARSPARGVSGWLDGGGWQTRWRCLGRL